MIARITTEHSRAKSYDILVSYQRNDDDQRRQLVEALEARGYAVFWDGKLGPDYWRVEWRNRLHQSKLMIVLWSVTAAESDEVKNEAGGATALEKCLSVPLDGAAHVPKPYLETNRQHWDRNADEATRRAQLERILDKVAQIVGPPHGTLAPQPLDKIPSRRAPSKLMDRRHFGKCAFRFLFVAGAGLAGGGARYQAEAGGSNPIMTFIRLGRDFGTAEEVAATFVRANTPTLMASYSVFFPELFRRRGFGALNELQAAAAAQKSIYTQDHHRLDALPSIAAAHWMREAKDDETRGHMTQLILRGLADSRSEVREIVIQNMITAVAPDFDLVRTFDPQVILRIQEIVGEACENEKLGKPALHCTEFLLNARALLRSKNVSAGELEPYNDAIRFVESICAPHMIYLPKLIQLHEATFRVSPIDVASLPPQSAEGLMCWQRFDGAREYFALLALMWARLAFTNMRTASGRLVSDTVISTSEAMRALPKIHDFIKAFELTDLLNGSSVVEIVSSHEPEFAKFLKSEFRELLEFPEKLGVSQKDAEMSSEMIELRKCVPFSQYKDRSVFGRAVSERDERLRRAYWEAVIEGGKFAGGAAVVLILLSWLVGKRELPSNLPTRDAMEEARAGLDARERAVDDGEYSGLDQQQVNLGPIDMSRL